MSSPNLALDIGAKSPYSAPSMIKMTETARLLADIEAFLVRTGMRASMLGHKCGANDGKVVDRLRNGRTVTIDTAAAVRAFIDDYEGRPRRRRQKKVPAQAAA